MQQQTRPPLPPFDEASAREKVKKAQDAWNTRDPEKVSLAYNAGLEVAQPRRVLRGSRRDRRLPNAQVGARARLQVDEGAVVLPGQPHLRALRVRVEG